MKPIYRENPYLGEINTVIDRIESDAATGGKVLFCRENLFAEGGGQPRDYGVVTIGNQSYPVLSLLKQKGNVGLLVQCEGELERGTSIGCKIDLSRRLKIMRLHSAQHTLAASVRRVLPEYQSRGMSISEDANICSMFFSLTGVVGENKFGKAELTEALGIFQDIVTIDHKVSAIQCESIEEAEKQFGATFRSSDPGLSFKGRVRVVVIEGVDANACGGTHVHSTGEIGEITVKATLFDDLLGVYCLDFMLH